MTGKSSFIDPAIQEYIIEQTVREHPVLAQLREETSKRSNAAMEIGPEQGALMQLLARTIDARSYLEIGVFTGYSALAMALALPSNGRVVACDVSEEYTAVARRYWEMAGVSGKIDLRLAPALETVKALESAGESFDMAFIDADKTNVGNYYEAALRLVRTGGLILVDNVLWGGDVVDPANTDADTVALRDVVAKAGRDERVDVSLIATCDGILIARKR